MASIVGNAKNTRRALSSNVCFACFNNSNVYDAIKATVQHGCGVIGEYLLEVLAVRQTMHTHIYPI